MIFEAAPIRGRRTVADLVTRAASGDKQARDVFEVDPRWQLAPDVTWARGRLPLRPLCRGALWASCRGLDGGEDAEVLAQSGDVQPLVHRW